MSSNFGWTCPYCQCKATITQENLSADLHFFDKGNKDGGRAIQTKVIVCPNSDCKEFVIDAYLHTATIQPGIRSTYNTKAIEQWRLKPDSAAKIFPDYIPISLLQDYKEACLIRDLSPKASATLSRRCLQGIIRDFWGISKDRLADEIKALKDRIDPTTWKAINAVKNIGNIGAYMEKDISLIIDIDPDEAELLIGLIEVLFKEWYVHQHEREEQMQAIVDIAAQKARMKNGGQ